MRQLVFSICIVLLALWLKGREQKDIIRSAAVDAAKNAVISIFDSNLPHISLEYFLKYESNNAPIDWDIVTCDKHAGNPARDQHDRMAHPENDSDSPLCVQATVDDVAAQRSATVVVQVGTVSKGVSGKPVLQFVTFQDENGVAHRIALIDLPAAMRSWRPRRPRIRDLPQRLGTIASLELWNCRVNVLWLALCPTCVAC